MITDINDFSFISKERVKKAIKELTERPLPKYEGTCDEMVFEYVIKISETIVEAFGMPMIHYKKAKQTTFGPIYRVRDFVGINNFDLFQEFSYPPASVTKMGRCNFDHFPVFYGSPDPEVAIMETIRASSSFTEAIYCVSIWEINQTEEELIMQEFQNVELPPVNPFSHYYHELKNELKKDFTGIINEEQIEALDLYLKFLSSHFVNDDYSISAAIACWFLYSDRPDRTDILVYPSIQTNKRGVSMAIAPNFVNNNMKIKRLYSLFVDHSGSGLFRIRPWQYGVINRNMIIWKDFNKDDNDHIEMFSKDFKRFTRGEDMEVKL